MSTLVTNNIQNLAGTASTSADNVINGSAKAWVNYKGTATRGINASYNVGSITVNGTGDFTVNFTTALADANYVVAGGPLEGTGSGTNVIVTYAVGGYATTPTLKTASQYRFITMQGGVATDAFNISLAFIR